LLQVGMVGNARGCIYVLFVPTGSSGHATSALLRLTSLAASRTLRRCQHSQVPLRVPLALPPAWDNKCSNYGARLTPCFGAASTHAAPCQEMVNIRHGTAQFYNYYTPLWTKGNGGKLKLSVTHPSPVPFFPRFLLQS
jgi:hypothetical protein